MQNALKGDRPLDRRRHSFVLGVLPVHRSFVISWFSRRKTGSVRIRRRLLENF